MNCVKEISDLLKKNNQGIKIDLACGKNKQKGGWIGIDMFPYKGVDIVHDLEKFPWPLPKECANLIVASHIVEHINPHKGVFIKFMDEAWRVLKVGGQLAIATPYGNGHGFLQDPTHCNPCSEATWFYFDPCHSSKLYRFYEPKPWKIADLHWNQVGNIEVLLDKRKEEKKYE